MNLKDLHPRRDYGPEKTKTVLHITQVNFK